MKANHNATVQDTQLPLAVSNGSKILKWKQITTGKGKTWIGESCFQWFKDTKMKANHNLSRIQSNQQSAVSNGSKILKWKQITTELWRKILLQCCFQWFKDTKMKANHNPPSHSVTYSSAVSNGSKILKWKQITTEVSEYMPERELFPMVQRY